MSDLISDPTVRRYTYHTKPDALGLKVEIIDETRAVDAQS